MEDNVTTITDERLKEFCEWFVDHFHKTETFAASMSISAAGYFHVTSKDAMRLLERCHSLGFIKMLRGSILILVGGDVVAQPRPAEHKRVGRPRKATSTETKPKKKQVIPKPVQPVESGVYGDGTCAACRRFSGWHGRLASGFCLRRKQGVKGNGTCGYYEKE